MALTLKDTFYPFWQMLLKNDVETWFNKNIYKIE